VSSTCFEHPSVHPQKDLYCTCHRPDCLHGRMQEIP